MFGPESSTRDNHRAPKIVRDGTPPDEGDSATPTGASRQGIEAEGRQIRNPKSEIPNFLDVGQVSNPTPSRQNPPGDGEDGGGEVAGGEVVGDDADSTR